MIASIDVILAIQSIYPKINGGFVYWETQYDGSPWINPIDGLIWENTEYPKPTWDEISNRIVQVQITSAITQKLLLLDEYYYNDIELRRITINNYFILSATADGRSLINEQIALLEQQIHLGIITTEQAIFEYFYNGNSVKITLNNLRDIYIFIMTLVNENYKIYRMHIKAIKALTSINDIAQYCFTDQFRKKQNLDIIV